METNFEASDWDILVATKKDSGTEITTETVYGHLLGSSSSHTEDHTHRGEHAERGQRCSACRWFEVDIFDTSEDADSGYDYLAYTCGRTTVPDEVARPQSVWTNSAESVVTALYVRDSKGKYNLPHASKSALDEAAALDEDIKAAYADVRGRLLMGGDLRG